MKKEIIKALNGALYTFAMMLACGMICWAILCPFVSLKNPWNLLYILLMIPGIVLGKTAKFITIKNN